MLNFMQKRSRLKNAIAAAAFAISIGAPSSISASNTSTQDSNPAKETHKTAFNKNAQKPPLPHYKNIDIAKGVNLAFNDNAPRRDVMDIRGDIETIMMTYATSHNCPVPEDFRKAAYVVQQLTGVPHDLLLGIICEESSFTPTFTENGGGGYIQSLRSSLFEDLTIAQKNPPGENPASDLIRSKLPEYLPLAYSRYITKDPDGAYQINNAHLRLTFLDPERLAALHPETQIDILGTGPALAGFSDKDAIAHTLDVRRAENLAQTIELYHSIGEDVFFSMLDLAQRLLNAKEKLEAKNLPLTGVNFYAMHFHGDVPGLRFAELLKTNPKAPITNIFGNDQAAVLSKYAANINHDVNKNLYYSDDGSFLTVAGANAYFVNAKHFSNDPVHFLPTDNTLNNGVRAGTIKIDMNLSEDLRRTLKDIKENAKIIALNAEKLKEERAGSSVLARQDVDEKIPSI